MMMNTGIMLLQQRTDTVRLNEPTIWTLSHKKERDDKLLFQNNQAFTFVKLMPKVEGVECAIYL